MRWQGAGLEQTGAEGGPIVRKVERVCGRLWRPQSRRCVAVRAEVPWATKVLRGLEPSWRDQPGTRACPLPFGREGRDSARVGINPAEGRPLSSYTDFTSVIDKIMIWLGDLIFTQRHAI